MKRPALFRVYLAVLTVTLVAVLVSTALNPDQFARNLWAWAFITATFALLESADLLFHHEGGREGLSASETVLLPLVVGFSFGQAVWGVVIAITLTSILDKRVSGTKALFNVTELGCAAAAGAGIWSLLSEPAQTLTPRNAVVAAAAILFFATLTHVFVSGAITLAQGGSFKPFSGGVTSVLGWNLGGNITLGLFLAASFLNSEWTVLLFPLALAALFVGYRAVVRQSAERERVIHLHSATRALATNPTLDAALLGFLRAVQEVASAREAHVIVESSKGNVWTGVRGDEVLADMVPASGGPLTGVLTSLQDSAEPLVASSGNAAKLYVDLLDNLGGETMIAVPLLDGDSVAGCLLVLDRVGADDFGPSDVKLLETLANELVVTLDSHRLFEQVSEERERFRKIFNSSKEGVVLLDESARVRAWNPAATRITGFMSAEMEGHVWSDFIVIRTQEHDRLVGAGVTEVSPEAELELVTKEGPSRWVSLLSSPVQGTEKGWVVLIRDVTTEHILEESKSDFLSTISHELRTPLTTIKGSVQVLNRKKDEQSPMQQQMLSVLQRGTDRLERLVLNLLFVSQLDADERVKVHPEEVQLEEIVRMRTEVMAADHPDVTVHEPDAPVTARADRERMLQVIDHLVENAVKFSPDGAIEIETGTDGGFAYVSVKDNGPGIPTVDQDRIFERFVRLGHVLTRETQGPGVGLFIVKKAVEAMGGQVHLESSPGKGSTFTVTVPLARPAVVAEAPA